MRILDTLGFGKIALTANPTRTLLILLAMSIGVASVIILTSLGEGARKYVSAQFETLGSELLFILPGKRETTGGLPPLLGTSPKDLTIEDALSLKRSRAIAYVAPVILGAAPVSFASREREVVIFGSSSDLKAALDLPLAAGHFLPDDDPRNAASICIIGNKLKKELFDNKKAIGEWLRIGERRFRVIGELSAKGQSVGMDLSDTAIIPVASAEILFNKASLSRMIVKARGKESLDKAEADILRTIKQRHDGDEDITILRQDSLLQTFDGVLQTLTWALAGIAAISLIVAGILIMNVMLVSVSQRKSEIGLLKALGAPTRQVLTLFLSEALMLSIAGGIIGVFIGLAGAKMIAYFIPNFPVQTPLWAIAASLIVTIITGLIFGSIPASKAAKLNPVLALSDK
ncbi:ABC transporter permease [Cocleimonas sp. KMM 6892]|uniref:ABC transporter permease n=1 Tax=unclassified Cocleimonas TaxID=2639732 RepID=UPI002DB5FCED|nr:MULTISPECIES: ABC transporter permease [unclassified Cocleimonas]MEB8431751.1 ABC transporter permease [Cocleimonas sp. KMM 6892]MEC4715163.1 ABC transporter permease [Cocleimonas sp. KMM 6895]MEC4744023.1 ABC transporter permease [Cocleimonas sp. KMM 6896]